MKRIKRQTILITGAAKGIGHAIACRLSESLADSETDCNFVLNTHTDNAALSTLADRLKAVWGSDHIMTSVGDVGDDRYVAQFLADVHQRFGCVDVLINNAGISYIGLLTDMDTKDWMRVINTNLNSVFYLSKGVIPQMVSQKSGKIINISSVWGNVGASCEVAYATAKGGVNAFTKSLAKELAPSNISVNAIACGIIDTAMNHCFDDDELDTLIDEVPMGRMGTPEEVAQMVEQLLHAPDYLTGQIITLDGGWQ